MTLRTALLGVQTLTFFALGALLLVHHEWRLGAAQALLGVVQVLIYAEVT